MSIVRLRPWLIAAMLIFSAAFVVGLSNMPASAEADDSDSDSDSDSDGCDPDDVGVGPSATPVGYDGFLVYMQNGEVDPADALLAGDMSFYTDVMGFSDDEIDDFVDDRLEIIEDRFGIADPTTNPNVAVLIGTSNPALKYTAYVVGGRAVSSEGWVVREGAILVAVTNPAGLDLGGDFAGVHVPPGTTLAGGIYNLEVTDTCGVPTGEEIVIQFVSSTPIVVGGEAGFTFRFFCEIESFDFPGAAPGEPARGLAQGTSNAKLIPGTDLAKLSTRNVLTFSNIPELGDEFNGY